MTALAAAVVGVRSVRGRACPLCETPAGLPCQPKPAGDHLARFWTLTPPASSPRQYMAMVLGELVVIDGCTVVAGPACCYCGRTGTRLEARPCCSRPEHRHRELACADTDDCLAFLLGGAR